MTLGRWAAAAWLLVQNEEWRPKQWNGKAQFEVRLHALHPGLLGGCQVCPLPCSTRELLM